MTTFISSKVSSSSKITLIQTETIILDEKAVDELWHFDQVETFTKKHKNLPSSYYWES